MYEIRQTAEFWTWLASLRDREARRRIAMRLVRLEAGLFGDVKYFGGIGELRMDLGPGYRIYFVRRGKVVVILLCGGDKASQERDIRKAFEMAEKM
jgi:putative addiction module killer protein